MQPVLRLALALFVLAWILGPYWLRRTVPLWVVFVVALTLELHFFAGGFRRTHSRGRRREPLASDRERYGYGEAGDELLLVRDGDEELWIPYSGETGEKLEALLEEARAPLEPDEEPELEPELGTSEPRRLPLGRALTGAAFVAGIGVVLWLADARTGWDSVDADARATATARFSAEAARIAGKPVTIRCDESGRYVGAVQHADGVAVVGGDLAYLTPERCLDLYRLAFEDEVRGAQTGRALAVLAHEAWHLRGLRDEGTTECYALQSAVGLGERLGLSPERAHQLMRQQLTENALRRGGSAEYLVPPGCRDGGPLDLDPRSRNFP